MTIEATHTEINTVAGKGTVSPVMLAQGLASVIPHAVSKTDTIPALSTVKFETSADLLTLTIVATNRYTLATYRLDWDGGEVNALLGIDDAKALLAFAKKAGRISHIALAFDDVSVSAFDFVNRVEFRLRVENFPSWPSLIPSADQNHAGRIDVINFNPALLALFAKGANKSEPMRLTFAADATKPVRIDIGDQFTGLIMPVRSRS